MRQTDYASDTDRHFGDAVAGETEARMGQRGLTAVTGADASKEAAWSIARNWQPGYKPEDTPDE